MPEKNHESEDLTEEELDSVRHYFWRDKEFQNMVIKLRNTWLLHKISKKQLFEYTRESLKQAKERAKSEEEKN